MSNPPVPPSNPDGSEQDQPPVYGQQDVPRYGKQQPPPVPQYGQQAPQEPQYGQQPPQEPRYGQQQPPVPQYGQQAPQEPRYGQQQPSVPQYGTPGYGQSPYSQHAFGQPQAPKDVPKLVNIAFWLIVGSGVVWVLSVLLSIGLIDNPALREQFEQQMAASGAQIDYESIKGMLIGTIVVVAAIGAGLYALIALNIRKGRNWARILGTVFAALSVLGLFPLGPGTLAALAGIAGIVLLYLPDAAPYFQKGQPFANPYGQPGAPFGR